MLTPTTGAKLVDFGLAKPAALLARMATLTAILVSGFGRHVPASIGRE